MGLGYFMVDLLLDCHGKHIFENMENVVDFGAQEMFVTYDDLSELLQKSGITDYDKSKFENLRHMPDRPRCSAKDFYSLLGFKNYNCIDISNQHGALNIDLNYPLEDKSLYSKFDLVTDFGTNEHVFNTVEAYRTMHRMCKKNGLLFIQQGFYKNGNGFFRYDPSFFENMAASNNYSILLSCFTIFTKLKTPHGSNLDFGIPVRVELLDAFNLNELFNVGICYVMKKNDDKDFNYSYQGNYLQKQMNNDGFEVKYLSHPKRRLYVPIYSESKFDMKNLLKIMIKKLIRYKR